MLNSLTTTFYWDTDDTRLLACEIRLIQQQQQQLKSNKHEKPQKDNSDSAKNTDSLEVAESNAMIIFVTDLNEIKELERFCLARGEQLINLCIPNVVNIIFAIFINRYNIRSIVLFFLLLLIFTDNIKHG